MEIARAVTNARESAESVRMLTLFTTAKAFEGHFAVIQYNALRSWKLLGRDVEIILFGEDGGSAEAAKELGLRHEAKVAKNEQGTNLVNYMFEKAQEIAKHELVCYVNCDIVLTSEFRAAAMRLRPWGQRFLMVGRRWDVEITEPLDFTQSDWEERVTQHAKTRGFQRLYYNIDYFLFTKGLYKEIPPFAIGRLMWDNWLVWKAHEMGAPVVDASAAVCAVHQNHDYSHHAQGTQGVWDGAEASGNIEMGGGLSHRRTIEDSTYRMTASGEIEKNRWYWLAPGKRRARSAKRAVAGWIRTKMWHPVLDATRSARHAMGLKKEAMPKALRRKVKRHWQDV